MKNNSRKHRKILINIGLTDKEADVYLAALVLGLTTPAEISLKSGVKRSTVYLISDQLKKKGLISEEYDGFKKKLLAAPPEVLERLVENNRNRLKDVIPDLSTLQKYKESEQKLRSVEGKEGLFSIIELMFKEPERGEEYRVIANLEPLHQAFGSRFEKLIENRTRFGASAKSILLRGEYSEKLYNMQSALREEIVLVDEAVFDANLVISNKRIVYPKHTPNLGAIVIENPGIVQTHKQIFDMLFAKIKTER